MNEMREKEQKTPMSKHNRRSFFKTTYKYLTGIVIFLIASVFGLKRDGDFRIGKMKVSNFGFSEAHGECGSSYDCAGGGGECGSSYDCAGGGGECGSSYDCAGGGGKCGSSYDCSGS